jgi:hypothetical protein
MPLACPNCVYNYSACYIDMCGSKSFVIAACTSMQLMSPLSIWKTRLFPKVFVCVRTRNQVQRFRFPSINQQGIGAHCGGPNGRYTFVLGLVI